PQKQIGIIQGRGILVVQVNLDLRPHFVLDLLRRALHGGLPIYDAGRFPVRNTDRKNTLDPPVSVLGEIHTLPELLLGDRGKCPGRVDIETVAVNDRNILSQEELHSVHPRCPELTQIRERWRRGLQFVSHKRGHDLDRKGSDIKVRLNVQGLSRLSQGCLSNPLTVSVEGAHGHVFVEFHPELLQVSHPRIDPDLGRRTVEQAVEAPLEAERAKIKLKQSVTHGACAAFLGAHGDERACLTLGEKAVIWNRLVGGVDELPPGNLLVLGQTALLTTGQKNQQPVNEEQHFVFRNPQIRGKQSAQRSSPVVSALRELVRKHDLRFADPRDLRARGLNQIVKHSLPVGAERDALHGICNMLVEAREEPEAVLPRKVLPSVLARAGNEDGSRLPAPTTFCFVDCHLKAAFVQFLRSTQSANPTTQDRN